MSLYKKLVPPKVSDDSIKKVIASINEQIDKLNIMIKNKETKSTKVKGHIVYTDGSCCKNGKKGSNGASGIYIHKSSFVDNTSLGKKLNSYTFDYNKTKYEYEVTNIRTEGYALVYTLHIFKLALIDKKTINKSNIVNILNSNHLPKLSTLSKTKYPINLSTTEIKDTINIYTDSKFWLDVYTKWIDNWVRQDKLLTYKNVDILLYLNYYKTLFINNNIDIILTHVYSHQKGSNISEEAELNNKVDKIAVAANELGHYNFELFD